ncbi:MAG: hypothetical protein KBD83_05005 [Gammaproteobacteria bacterium]|nr:hypothetical protein [Gammaproteobacteria bacterium]
MLAARVENILEVLANRKILFNQSEATEDEQQLVINSKFNLLRNATETARRHLQAKRKLSFMTHSYAITELQVAACSEISFRFSYEYMNQYRDTNVTIFAIGSSVEGGGNHMMVLIGEVNNIDTFVELNSRSKNSIKDFLEAQSAECLLVDPYFKKYGPANIFYSEIEPYCERNGICEILSVSPFNKISEAVLARLEEVRVDGAELARTINITVLQEALNSCSRLKKIEQKWTFHSKNNAYYLQYTVEIKDKIEGLQQIFLEHNVRLQMLSKGDKLYLACPALSLDLLQLVSVSRRLAANLQLEIHVMQLGLARTL